LLKLHLPSFYPSNDFSKIAINKTPAIIDDTSDCVLKALEETGKIVAAAEDGMKIEIHNKLKNYF